MLNLVQNECERVDSRFLEPACGSGNFLIAVFKRKLNTVEVRYGKSDFEKRNNALFSLMCIYGIELLLDNVNECRSNLLTLFCKFLDIDSEDIWGKAASNVLSANIVQGDALTLTTSSEEPIIFPEWGYLGSGKFQRRDFLFDALTKRASFEGTLFEVLEEHDLFIPIKTYSVMKVEEIAK